NILRGVGLEFKQLAYARSVLWSGLSAAITNISNTGPVVVTTLAPSAILDQETVCLAGTGLTGLDLSTSGRCWTAHVLTGSTFSLNGTSATGTSTTGTVSTSGQYWPH